MSEYFDVPCTLEHTKRLRARYGNKWDQPIHITTLSLAEPLELFISCICLVSGYSDVNMRVYMKDFISAAVCRKIKKVVSVHMLLPFEFGGHGSDIDITCSIKANNIIDLENKDLYVVPITDFYFYPHIEKFDNATIYIPELVSLLRTLSIDEIECNKDCEVIHIGKTTVLLKDVGDKPKDNAVLNIIFESVVTFDLNINMMTIIAECTTIKHLELKKATDDLRALTFENN